MPSTSNVSAPNKGMLQDLHQLNTDGNTYTFALNAVVEDFSYGNTTFIQNEPSNILSTEFPPGYQVVGFREIPEQKRTIYFLVNPLTKVSQIGEVLNCNIEYNTDKIKKIYCSNCPEYVGEETPVLEDREEKGICQYRALIINSCLGFDVNYPVDIEYKITNCSLNLYFTDVINERRFVYFDYRDNDITKELMLQDRFKVIIGYGDNECKVPVYDFNSLDCQKIKVHPNYKRPCINFEGFINGGILKAGDYQILIAYSDAYGNPMSAYFPSTQPASLFTRSVTFETNYDTTKALKFSVSDLKSDSLFQYYNIVIAQTIDNFTEFILAGTFSTTQTNYVYTGFEKSVKRLTAQDVFFKRPYYKSAKGVTTANNYLFYSGVKEYPTLNLQPVANKVKLQWETVALKEGAYADARNVVDYRGYMRDEVYAFAIVFEFDNGRESCAFHIPGREATANDLTSVCNDDVIAEEICEPLTTTTTLPILPTTSTTKKPTTTTTTYRPTTTSTTAVSPTTTRKPTTTTSTTTRRWYTTTTTAPPTTTTTAPPTTTTTALPTTSTTTKAVQNCLDGLSIETIYLSSTSDLELLPLGYTHPCPDQVGAHICNRAFFEIYGNNIYIGDSILNNDDGEGGIVTQSGKKACVDYKNLPDALTGGTWTGNSLSRYSKVVITSAQASAIAAASTSGTTIDFSLVSTQTIYNTSCDSTTIPHSNVTWTRISKSDGTVLYNGCPANNFLQLNVCN
jgi:hypothetical protein